MWFREVLMRLRVGMMNDAVCASQWLSSRMHMGSLIIVANPRCEMSRPSPPLLCFIAPSSRIAQLKPRPARTSLTFPVPFFALARISLPVSAMGIASSWIGLGFSKPAV